jgi:hypothetical protein
VSKFGTIPNMEPLDNVTATPMRVGQSTPKAAATPFLSHQVPAENLQGRTVQGFNLAQLLATDGAAWCGIKVLGSDRRVGVVLGVALKSDAESAVWYTVAYSDAPDVQLVISAKEVFKGYLAYEADASKADFGASPRDALAMALQSTPMVDSAQGHHRSALMLSCGQVAGMGAALGTPVPGAPSLMPASYAGGQVDHIVAAQLSVPVNSRQAAAQVQTMGWLDSVSVHVNQETGKIKDSVHDRRPAASTAFNMIIERKLSSLRKTRIKFFIRPVDILLMMRCKHGELDLTRFQAQESSATKPPKFENTRTGLTMFVLALRRAKSMEVGQSEDHLAGWDFLVERAERLLEMGFAHAMPKDLYSWVGSVFETFSLEHRDAVMGSRAMAEYPTFDRLQDLDGEVQSASMMLKEGNTMRRHVARILDDKTTATPKKSKRPKSPKAK